MRRKPAAKCRKRRYPTRDAALRALRRIQVSTSAAGLIPSDAYLCRPCRAWRLTSSIGPHRRP